MLDIKFILENFTEVQKNLGQRNFDIKVLDKVKTLNEERKSIITAVETCQAKLKQMAKEIGQAKKQGQDASGLMAQVAELKAGMEQDAKLREEKEAELQSLLSTSPNLIAPDVPFGEDDKDNQEISRWGEPRHFDFKPLDHATLGENLAMLDFERGAKITGARFVFYRQDLARLERALVNFMLEEHAKVGYEEVIPPFIANADSLYGTGQLPKFAEDLFKVEGRPWYLVPTAEVPVTNFKRGELFAASELPYKFCAYTPCFRSEAGSYGKDTRGLIRLHQFNKVEMVNIVKAEDSVAAHEAMIKEAEHILEALNLPYRAVVLCSRDIGFSARKCVDLEVWLPGMGNYREISSISNCWDFQARRAQIRYRNEAGKPVYAHTLNGSGLAVGRTLVAVMENYQQADGSITIPPILRPYMNGQEIIRKH